MALDQFKDPNPTPTTCVEGTYLPLCFCHLSFEILEETEQVPEPDGLYSSVLTSQQTQHQKVCSSSGVSIQSACSSTNLVVTKQLPILIHRIKIIFFLLLSGKDAHNL